MIEVIIVIALLSVVASSILLFLTSLLTNVTETKQSTRALGIAEESLEAVRTIRDADWNALTAGSYGLSESGGVWSLSGASDTVEGYTRTITITELTSSEKQVDIALVWNEETIRPREFELTSVLTDWRNAEDSADEPGGGLSGDWGSPSLLGTTIDLGWGDRGQAVDISSSTLYLVSNAILSFWDDVYILDMSDPLNPVVHDTIHTGSGLNEVSINDDKTVLFVANDSGAYPLQILDVADIDDISILKQFNPTGNYADGMSVEAFGSHVILGTDNNPGTEIMIVDASDPSAPSTVSQIEAGGTVRDIHVKNNLAYIGTDNDAAELLVVDVTDPENPVTTSTVDLPGANNPEAVFMGKDYVFVGRTDSSGDTTPEVVLVDLSDMSNPVIAGTLELDHDINGIYATEDLLFLASESGEEFQVYDFSDPEMITYYSGIDFASSYFPTDLTFEDNVFYMTIWWSQALRVITAY